MADATDYVVTLAPEGDDRTHGLRRMTLAEATTVALDAVAAGKHPRVIPAPELTPDTYSLPDRYWHR